MKPHQIAHWQQSILVSHSSAGSTAPGLLCLATFSSGLHIFTPPPRSWRVLSKPYFTAPNLPISLLRGLQCSRNICHHYWSRVAVLGLGLHVGLVQAWIAETPLVYKRVIPPQEHLPFFMLERQEGKRLPLYTGYWLLNLLPKAWYLNQTKRKTRQSNPQTPWNRVAYSIWNSKQNYDYLVFFCAKPTFPNIMHTSTVIVLKSSLLMEYSRNEKQRSSELWKKKKKQQKQNTNQQSKQNQTAGAWPGLCPSTDLNNSLPSTCPDQSISYNYHTSLLVHAITSAEHIE